MKNNLLTGYADADSTVGVVVRIGHDDVKVAGSHHGRDFLHVWVGPGQLVQFLPGLDPLVGTLALLLLLRLVGLKQQKLSNCHKLFYFQKAIDC